MKTIQNAEISLFVTQKSASSEPYDPNIQNHSTTLFGKHVVKKINAKIMDQWEETIDQLLKISSTVRNRDNEWTLDEITVGFTLSAKGELLFIAEAGATASISVKLKRKTTLKDD